MGPEQLRLLAHMKHLIKIGKRRIQIRPDRNLYEDLIDIGIDEKEMWKHISYLNPKYYYNDPKPYYKQSDSLLTFIKDINNINVYIKIRIEKDIHKDEEVVVISFHRSTRRK